MPDVKIKPKPKLVATEPDQTKIDDFLKALEERNDPVFHAARTLVRLEGKDVYDCVPARMDALREEGELDRVLDESGVTDERKRRAKAAEPASADEKELEAASEKSPPVPPPGSPEELIGERTEGPGPIFPLVVDEPLPRPLGEPLEGEVVFPEPVLPKAPGEGE